MRVVLPLISLLVAVPAHGQSGRLLSPLGELIHALLAFGLVFFVILTVVTFVYTGNGPQAEESLAHWHATIPGLRIPADRFLDALENQIKRQKIPNTKMSQVNLYESGGLVPATRTYIRVRKNRLNFYVFGAPLGESFFVSSWLIKPRSLLTQFLVRLPLFGRLFAGLLRRRETLFAYDSALHFMETVHHTVLGVVDMITEKEHVQPLPQEQRKPIMRELYGGPQAPRMNL